MARSTDGGEKHFGGILPHTPPTHTTEDARGAETEAAAIGHRDLFALFFECAAAAAEWVGEESGGIWGTFGWADAQRMGEEKLGRSVSRRISH